MNKKISKIQIFIWVLAFASFLTAAFFYGRLPDQIPTNWGFNGTVTYGSKNTIWIISGLAPFLAVLFFFLPLIDPKKRSYSKFYSSYELFQVVIMLFLLIMTGIIITESLRPGTVNVFMVICAMCGILYIVLGNMMPKFRQNYFCGFKTPWTLSSEIVWNRTHRLGGRLIFTAGLICFGGAFIPSDFWRIIFLAVPLSIAVIIPSVMSYIWFKQQDISE